MRPEQLGLGLENALMFCLEVTAMALSIAAAGRLIFQITFRAPAVFHVLWKGLGREGKVDRDPACS